MNWIIDPNKQYTPPRMPLQAPEKPAGAFSGGGGYLPSGEQVKRISDLLIEITRHMQKDQSNLDEFERTLKKLKRKWDGRSDNGRVRKSKDGSGESKSTDEGHVVAE